MSRRSVLQLIYALVLLIAIAGLYSAQASRPPVSLTVVANGSPADEDYHGARAFKDYVEAETSGRVVVEIFPFGQYCANARECIEFLQSGVLDVFMTTPGGIGNYFGPAQVIDMPYLFASDSVVECVVDGSFLAALREAVLGEGLGLRLMVIGNTGGWRSFATVSRQVREPADLQGLKIRSTSAPVQQVFIREQGASPTPISWSELYTAMATGVVDGTTNSLPDIIAANLHEQLNHIVLDQHSYMGALWWLSQESWQGLSAEDQQIVAQGFDVLRETTRRKAHENEGRARQLFLEKGGEIITPTPQARAAFRQAAVAVEDRFAQRYGSDWLRLLRNEIARCETHLAAS